MQKIFTHLKDGKSIVSNSWIVELRDRNCCYKPSNSQHSQVPVVRVAKEERVLVGVGQMEYYQTSYLTHKRKADQELKGIEIIYTVCHALYMYMYMQSGPMNGIVQLSKLCICHIICVTCLSYVCHVLLSVLPATLAVLRRDHHLCLCT